MLAYLTINLFVIIFLFFIFIKLQRNLKGRKDGLLLLGTILTSIIVALSDAIYALVEGSNNYIASIINHIASSSYFFFLVLTSYLWLCFACTYKVRIKEQKTKIKIWLIAAGIPIVAFFIFAFTNYWHHLIFDVTIDEQGAYHYASNVIGHSIHLTLSISYLLFGSIACLFYYSKAPNDYVKKEYVNMLTFIIFPTIMPLIQKLVVLLTDEIVPFTVIGIGLAFFFYYINIVENQISYDELTGLGNRYILKRYIREKMSDSLQESTYIIICDLDNLKKINDNYGHIEGDKALIETSNILKSVAEDNNTVVTRYGGDEFILVSSNIEELGVINLINLINEEFARFNLKNDKTNYQLHLTYGYTKILSLDKEINDVIKRADEMLLKRKNER